MDLHKVVKIQALFRGYMVRRNPLNNVLIYSLSMCGSLFRISKKFELYYWSRIHNYIHSQCITSCFDILGNDTEALVGIILQMQYMCRKCMFSKLEKRCKRCLGCVVRARPMVDDMCITFTNPKRLMPDFETPTSIVELKSRSYWCRGTAGVKVLGAINYYSAIPRLYGKPLVVVSLGRQEEESRHDFNLYDMDSMTPEQRAIHNLYQTMGCTHSPFSAILFDTIKMNESIFK